MKINIQTKEIKPYILDHEVGLEKESLRVDKNGRFAKTLHPFTNKEITRDFCENQVEMVTKPCNSPKEAYEYLKNMHNEAITLLSKQEEYLWLFSNPPYFENEDEIPIAQFKDKLKDKQIYREYLAEKYGKKKMLYSGIHYNFSYSKPFLEQAFKQSNYSNLFDFKNDLYLTLSQRIVEYAWLIVYLMSASPLFDPSYFDSKEQYEEIKDKYASARCSEIGYWNEFIPIINYENFNMYVNSIYNHIKAHTLKQESELYYPVRLKPKGENSLKTLEHLGVNHIELRMLDLNPLSPIGIFEEDITFIQLLLVYLISIDGVDALSLNDQVQAISNMKEAAKYDDEHIVIQYKMNLYNIKDITLQILNDMETVFGDIGKDVIQYQKNKLEHRYATQIKELYGDDYTNKGLQLSKKYVEFLNKE